MPHATDPLNYSSRKPPIPYRILRERQHSLDIIQIQMTMSKRTKHKNVGINVLVSVRILVEHLDKVQRID